MDTPAILLPMLSLLPFAVVGSFTPGPNNILVMSYGISHGLKATLPYQAGAGLSCFLIIVGTVLAGAQLEKILPPLMEAVKYVGCAYMLWLAWVVARSPAPRDPLEEDKDGDAGDSARSRGTPCDDKAAPCADKAAPCADKAAPCADKAASRDAAGKSSPPRRNIALGPSAATAHSGFILQFVNPKFYLYTITLAAVLAPAVRFRLDVFVIGLFFAAIVVAGMFVWAFAGALLQNFLRRWHRASSVVMALALVWCAVTLL